MIKKLDETQIERKVERAMDKIDRLFLSGRMTDGGYERAVAGIHDWAERQYRIWQIAMLRA